MTTPAQLRVAAGQPALDRTRGTIAQLALLVSSEGLLRIGNFALAILIAREYSPATLGIYAMAVAASTCAVTFADGGLQLSAIRWISADPLRISTFFSRVLASKLLLLPFAALVAGGILAGERVSTLWLACALVFVRTLLQSFAQMNYSVLKALRDVFPIAALQYAHFGLMSAVLFAAVKVDLRVVTLVGLLAGCQAAEFVGSAIFLRWRRLRLEAVSIAECCAAIRGSVPTAITTTISTVVFRGDLIILALFVSAEGTGQFAAAQFVIVAMYLAAWLLGSLILPEFAAEGSQPEWVRAIVRRWTRVLILLTVPATAVLIWFAPYAMHELFGPAYRQSAGLVSILLLATPFIWLNSLYLHRAIAVDDKRIHVRAYALVTGIAAALSMAFAWKFGTIGIAATAVAREASLFAVLFSMTVGWL